MKTDKKERWLIFDFLLNVFRKIIINQSKTAVAAVKNCKYAAACSD